MTTRRTFLKAATGSSALLTVAPQIPACWLHAAEESTANGTDRVLVVVQLSGGNDGLNTVVPYGDDEYYRNRFTLALGKEAVHSIDDYVGLHPSLRGLKDLVEEGDAAVVQGVGYENPNRSHFESMDLWHTAHQINQRIDTGWLGRLLDQAEASTEVAALHLGSEDQPLALAAKSVQVPTIASLDGFRLAMRQNPAMLRDVEAILAQPADSKNPLLQHIRASSLAAFTTSERVEAALGKDRSSQAYPSTMLATKLRNVAQLIDSGLGTRLFYVTLDGFDTHSNQVDAHAALLTELDGAISSFAADLRQRGSFDRVTTMVFSEFGRRVKENASRGTDHGAAAPMFLVGSGVQGGLHGRYPSLMDLDDGDLKHAVDYRSVYAAVLRDWFGTEPESILGDGFRPLDGLFA